MNPEIAIRYENRPYRPSWAVGITNEQLIAVARQEGVNPYHPEWADGLDSRVIKEARTGSYRNANTPTIAQLKRRASDDESEALEPRSMNMVSVTERKADANTEYVNGLFEDSCQCKAHVDVLTITRWNKLGYRIKRGEHGHKVDRYTLFCRCQVREGR